METADAAGAAVRTFLIADIRGYTRFTAQHGDEAASRLATRFAAIADEGVEAWGGRLVELRGDEALAVFSSARQALRAAAELQAAFIAATAEEPALPLTVGIGLDAGEAVPVGDGFRGAALNMAARLCSAAAAGVVLATTSLVNLAGPVPGLAAGDPESMTFKGVEQPVEVRRITDAVPRPTAPPVPLAGRAPTALPAELEPLVPLIGRGEELRRLRWHWRRAAAGDGRVVIVSGAPGIGKTRLVAELAGEVAASGLPVHYLPSGRPVPAGVEAAGDGDPALLVADDVDAAGPAIVELALRLAETAPGSRRLVVLVHRREAPGPLVARLETLAPREHRVLLGPLDADGVRAIVALYAGTAAGDAPVAELTTESGGVPASIHRVAGSWARRHATRRLGGSAERAASERRGLRAAEATLMADMSDLELARERERLYVGDPTIDPDPDAPIVCPYKGLAEFEAVDADFYFGRERLIAELVARFVGSAFLALVGDSGSGKSSALRAGLLPALAAGVLPGSEAWPQLILRPGEHPMAELGRALARLPDAQAIPAATPDALAAAVDRLPPGHRLVIVVDQFEETFNATRDEAERSAFLDLLTAERPGLKVIVSMRADHYGRCAAYPALARLMGTDQVLVGPLTRAELAAVVEHPAQRAGLRVEPALTAALVEDAGDEPGVLPLLSTALLELWQARDGSRLTLAAYRASGGLHGAIARLAESTWSGLDPHRRAVARSILLRLAGPGEGTALVRRRVPRAELDADRDPAVGEVLRSLTEARLLTAGEDTVEVAHEALLREWPRLQEWLAEDAAGREIRLHLIDAARDWEASGRDPGDLYRGARLATALEWSSDHALELNASERAFLDASRAASQQDVERQRRTNRRLRGLLVGTAGLLVLALAAGGLAFVQGRRAEDEAGRAAAEADRANAEAGRATTAQSQAEAAAQTARSRALLASAVAAIDTDPELAQLLAVEAAGSGGPPTFDSTTALHDVLAAEASAGRVTWPVERKVWGGVSTITPDGTGVISDVFTDDRVDAIERTDLTTGATPWSVGAPRYLDVSDWTVTEPRRTDQAAVLGVLGMWGFITPRLTDDGARVVAGVFWDDPGQRFLGDGLGIDVLDAATGRLERRIGTGPCGAMVLAVSGSRALAVRPQPLPSGACDWGDRTDVELFLADLDSGVMRPVDAHAVVSNAALAAGGTVVAWDRMDAQGDVVTTVRDVTSGATTLQVSSADVPTVQSRPGVTGLSPDGRLLIYGDRPALIYDATHGGTEPTGRVQALGGEGSGFTFDATGDSLFGTARDGRLRRWTMPTGLQMQSWPAAGNGPVSLTSDGRVALISVWNDTGFTPRAIRVDRDLRGDLGRLETCTGFTVADSLRSVPGRAAFLQACDGVDPLGGELQVIDTTGPARLVRTVHGSGSQRLAFSPDGSRVALQRITSQLEYGPMVVRDVATGDELLVLQGLCDWDDRTGREADPCKPFPDQPFGIWEGPVLWSPDGRWISVIDGNEGHGAIWDATTGALVRPLPSLDPDPAADPPRWFGQAWSPDGGSLYLSAPDGTVSRWSATDWTATGEATVLDADGQGIVPRLIGFDAQGRLLAWDARSGSQATTLYWLDPESLAVVASRPRVHEGSLKSAAFSPDLRTLVTGASDGVIRVWNALTGELLQEMHIDAQVQGVAFVDDHHVLVAPDGGDLLQMTIDSAELLGLVRSALSRGFTPTECTTYGLDPCPTLDALRSGGS
ncbi:MAG: AAA family ATPase [Chloroflexota bacterium]